MASREALKRPHRTTFGKMSSFFCFGEPRVHERASSPLKDEPVQPGAIKHIGKDKVDLLVEASSRCVVGTPVHWGQPAQLQAAEEDLRREKGVSAALRHQLHCLAAALVQERARSANLETKVADAEDRLLVSRMVAKAQLKAVASVVAEDVASQAAQQSEHELDVLREECRRREEDLIASVERLSQQVHEADYMDKLKKDKLKELMAKDLENNQKLAVATKRADEMAAQLEEMESEMESLKEALMHLPVLPEEDCRFIKDLGQGTYGRVKLRCIPVAVKEMKRPEDALELLKEQQAMSRLRHQAIPGAMAWVQHKNGTLGLAIQYVDGQSMEQFRKKRHAGESLDLDPTGPAGLSVLEQLTHPIEHIHLQGHVHRDVSCRNVMISEDYDGKFSPSLIDFGMAYDVRKPPTSWGGSPGFMRPAVVLLPHLMGPEDDVRSFCAVAWEFLSGRDIWHTLTSDCRAAIETNFSIEEDIQGCCAEHGCDFGDIVQCVAAAEYLGHIGIGEEYFEPLLKNPRTPARALRLIARGLSQAVARGQAAPPSLADIRAALEADRRDAEVAELMSVLLPLSRPSEGRALR